MLTRKVEGQLAVGNQRQLTPVCPVNRPDHLQPVHLLAHLVRQVLDRDLADIDDPVGCLAATR